MLMQENDLATKIDVTHRMGSVTVFLEANDQGDEWIVHSSRIGRWIQRYNEYWIINSGINAGKNLHWCYDRSVTLRGLNIHHQPKALTNLSGILKSQELNSNWVISLEEFLDLKPSPAVFLKAVGIGAITLVLDRLQDARVDDAFVEHICDLYNEDITVTLSGYMENVLESGLLERPEVNRAQVSMINRRGSADDKELRMGFRTNCQSRIQLVIGGHGYIYPCLGLAGLNFCVMGHIDDALEDVFQDNKNPNLDVNRWVERGPDIPEKLEAVVADGIVLECHHHREALVQKHRR